MNINESIIHAYRKYAENYDFVVKLYGLLGLRIKKYRKIAIKYLELSKEIGRAHV